MSPNLHAPGVAGGRVAAASGGVARLRHAPARGGVLAEAVERSGEPIAPLPLTPCAPGR